MTPQPPSKPPLRDATYFDQWYADMTSSPVRDEIVARHFGLPPGSPSTSLLSWPAIAEVSEELRLAPGGRLLDLACGRGSYGIEVARRSGARLVGVDFSAVALEQARSSADRLLPPGQADFKIGNLVATGLPAASVDGVLCVDSVQFAEPPLAALAEGRRLLTSGGRLVLSTWEATDPSDPRVGPRIRAVNLERDLPLAGFVEIQVQEKPDWRAVERAMWEEAVATTPDSDPVSEPVSDLADDPALESLQSEGRRSLAAWDSLRRVFATATAP